MTDRINDGCAWGQIGYTARIGSDEAHLCHCRTSQRHGRIAISVRIVTRAA